MAEGSGSEANPRQYKNMHLGQTPTEETWG